MKHKIEYIIIVLLLIFGCKSEIKNEIVSITDSLHIDTVTVNDKTIEIDTDIIELKNSILDSLKNDNSCSEKHLFAVENLFDFNNIKFDLKYLTLEFLCENIKIHEFNSCFLSL